LHEVFSGCNSSRIVRLVFVFLLLPGMSGVVSLGLTQAASPTEQKAAALYQEGMRLLHDKSYPQALEQFRKLEQSAPNLPQGYTGEGIALALSGKLEDAVAVLQKAIEIDPSYLVARRELGILDWQLLRKAEAAKELAPVVKLYPDDTPVNAILGQYAFEIKDYAAALQYFSKARAQVAMSVPLSLMNAEALIKTGHPGEAGSQLDLLAAAPNLSSKQQFQIAWLFGQARAYPKAIRMFQALPADFSDPFGRDYGIALAYYESRQYSDCIQLLLALKDRGLARAELFSLLGAAEEVSGNQPQAEEAFQSGLRLFPRDADNYLNQAGLAVKNQNYATAVELLNAGIQKIPGNYKLFLALGVVYSLEGSLNKAQESYEKAAALAPVEAGPYIGLGICFIDQNQYSQAADVLRGANQKGLADVRINYFLVDALFRQGLTPSSPLYQEAASAVDATIRMDPDFAYSYLQRGRLRIMGNQLEGAIADLEHARKLEPDSTVIQYQLATAYRLAGRTAESSKLFAQVSTANNAQDAKIRQTTLMGVMGAVSNADYSQK
jgi:tetratricopeptide (TPR) repeat protein